MLLGTFALFAQNVPTIEFVNKTGTFIQKIYISDPESDNWGKEILKEEVIFPNRSLSIPITRNGMWDVLVIDENDEEYTFFEVNVQGFKRIVVE